LLLALSFSVIINKAVSLITGCLGPILPCRQHGLISRAARILAHCAAPNISSPVAIYVITDFLSIC
jgi:hypothetical protein